MSWLNNPISFFITDGKRILHGNREAKNLFRLDEETIISCTFKSYLEEKAQRDWDDIAKCGHGHLFIAGKTLQFNILDFGDSSLYIIDNEPDDPCVLRLFGRIFKSDTANTMPTFILDSKRKIIDYNASFQDFVGTNEIKGLDCAKVIGCLTEENETCPVKNSLIYNRPCSLKLFSRATQRYIFSSIIPFKIRDNSIYFLGLLSDANLQLEMLYNETAKEYKKTKDILGLHPDLIFIQDENGVYQDLYANNENLLYVKKEEIIGKKTSDLLPKDLADALQEQITKTINDGKLYTYEYWLDVPAGKQAFEARIIKYDQDKVLIFVRNITEQKLLQKKIEDIEKKFSFAFSKNPVPIAIFKESDGTLLGASKGLYDLFKYKQEEIIGKTTVEIGIFGSTEERESFNANFTNQTDFSFEIEVKDAEGIKHLLSVYSRRMNIDSEDFLVVVAIDITELRKTQKELEESNQFNKWLLDNIQNVIIIQSSEGMEYIHPNIINLLGYTQKEMQNMPISQICHPEDVPKVWEYGKKLLSDPNFTTTKLNLRFVHKNCDTRYTEAIVSKGIFKGKNVAIVSILDISEITQLSQKLSENNEFLKSMLNSMRDSVFSVDKNLKYLYVHIPELESQGIDTSWLIGKAFGYNTDDDDPKEIEKISNAIIKSIEEKCSVSFPVRMKMLGKERMYEVVSTPLKNSFGESIGSVLLSKDITEQVQAEKQAQTEKKRFELIANNIKDILFEAKDGILTYISAGVFLTLGRNVEDFVGCPVTNFVSKLKLAKIVKLKNNEKFTIVIDDNYGRLRDIEIQFTKIDDTYFGIARDVTDERSQEEAKRIFLGSVVHELKNPLTLLLGYNDILLDKFRNDREIYEILQIIRDSAKREENQINQLLKYNIAKHQYQFLKADAKGIFYNIAVRTKMLLQRLSVEKYGEDLVTFNHNLASTLEGISINVDFQAFSEIFENLSVNAFKYSPKESINISLDVFTNEGMVKAVIKDQGFGMSKTIQREVFKPFYQFDHKNTEKSGSGIGLSTVKLHVESHGGSITLDSDEGKGTTFELSFPISG